MNELPKTLVFVAVALVSALVGYVTLPRTQTVSEESLVGEKLFPEFRDPLEAASLEIVKFDEKLGALDTFQVAKKNNQWVIPSQEDYPADAQQQLRDAAVALLDLKILGQASEREEDWSTYGVLEATTKLSPGDEGVGMLISLKDTRGTDLAKLIIGKAAKGENLYFVRRPDQAAVLVTKIDPKPFTTKFEDWIEKDLLNLNGWDIAKLTLKDYSLIFRNEQGSISVGTDPRMDAVLTFDDNQSAWSLRDLTLYDQAHKPVPARLGEYEELDNQKLNDLKNAIDELKIVDVLRKPAGLGASLTADESFSNDREAVMSLLQRGFLPHKGEILGRNGEVRASTKDGVEYILRFGEIAGADSNDAGKLNRYLFVTTRVDEKQLPKPELEAEPAEQPALPTAEDTKKPATSDEKKDEPSEPAAGCQAPEEEGAEAQPVQEEKPVDASAADQKPVDDQPAADKDDKPAEVTTPELSDTVRAERERIKKSNQRKLDEYNEKLKKAKSRVAELNARFADWYYVVSEDTYKKIHLGRSDIIKESAKAKEEGIGVDAFRELETQGLKK